MKSFPFFVLKIKTWLYKTSKHKTNFIFYFMNLILIMMGRNSKPVCDTNNLKHSEINAVDLKEAFKRKGKVATDVMRREEKQSSISFFF